MTKTYNIITKTLSKITKITKTENTTQKLYRNFVYFAPNQKHCTNFACLCRKENVNHIVIKVFWSFFFT